MRRSEGEVFEKRTTLMIFRMLFEALDRVIRDESGGVITTVGLHRWKLHIIFEVVLR